LTTAFFARLLTMGTNDLPADPQELLLRLSNDYGVSPEAIATTTAWREYAKSRDSLALVELVMGLEEELAGPSAG
jgi:hypothetical protein